MGQEKRNYNMPDADMLESCDTMRGHFEEDKPKFIEHNPKFADPFSTDWEVKINAALKFPDDETIDDQLQQKTATVEGAISRCKKKYQETKQFIEDAFPDNEAVWKEFGFDDYDKASHSQPEFIQFMYKFHGVAEKYKEKLGDEGYTQEKIDEIEALADNLKKMNKEQELFKGNIPVQTRERILLHNAANDDRKRVARAGKLIFADNYAKYQRYLLGPSDEEPDVFSIIGTVTDAATGEALAEVTVSIQNLGINTFTDSEGRYGFGALEDGAYEVHAHKDDYQPATVNADVAGDEPAVADIAMTPVS